MKNLVIQKYNKKIKINIYNSIINGNNIEKTLKVSGPLGDISYTLKNQPKDNRLFIKTTEIDFFIKKIKKLIKSVTTG